MGLVRNITGRSLKEITGIDFQNFFVAIQDYFATKTALATVAAAKEDKWPVIDHGTEDTTLAIGPNTVHKWGIVPSLTLTLDSGTDAYPHFWIQFTCPSDAATSLSLPDTIKYRDGEGPSWEAGQVVQLSILDGCLVGGGFQ